MSITIIESGVQGQPVSITVTSAKGLEVLGNNTLLTIYNFLLSRNTKKFATRAKALQQTWETIKDLRGYEIDVSASPPALRRREEAVDSPHVPSAASDPSPSSPQRGRGRPIQRDYKCMKLKDGTYSFKMQPRVARAAPGGRRPELIAQLRKRPTFNQLLQRFKVPGETAEQRAFNLATTITCMGGTCGYGVVTADDGRLDLLEPLS